MFFRLRKPACFTTIPSLNPIHPPLLDGLLKRRNNLILLPILASINSRLDTPMNKNVSLRRHHHLPWPFKIRPSRRYKLSTPIRLPFYTPSLERNTLQEPPAPFEFELVVYR